MSELDQAAIVVGLPKHGKTTIARMLVKEHLEKWGSGIAIVQDYNRQFGDLCARYETVEAFRAAATKARKEKRALPRGAAFGCKSSALAELARELGRLHNRDTDVRVPIMLVYDEASLMDTSGSTHISDIDEEINANRRHMGIAPVYNIQRPTALTEAFYTTATDVYVFSMPSAKRTSKLEELLGLADDRLAPLVGKPKFVHVHWKQGEGLV